MVSKRNQSSQVKAFPAMKHAKTLLTVMSLCIQRRGQGVQGTYSSVPIIPHVPVMKRASEKAKTRKLSRSTKLCSSAPAFRLVMMHQHVPDSDCEYSQCRSSFATHPTAAP